MDIDGQQIFEFLSHHGYWIIVPLMIIEGPVATIAAATLAALGAFNVWVVLILSIVSDIISDVGLYWIGKKWGMGFVRRIGKYVGITESLVLRMEKHFEKHGRKTIFAVKSTTGLCWATFIAAGIVRMDLKKFVYYSFLGGVVWSGFLVMMGYFYGYLWREIKQYIEWVGWAVSGVAIGSFVVITLYKNYKAKKIFSNGLLVKNRD